MMGYFGTFIYRMRNTFSLSQVARTAGAGIVAVKWACEVLGIEIEGPALHYTDTRPRGYRRSRRLTAGEAKRVIARLAQRPRLTLL